ncbi:NADPH-dependent 7-cyano-7-deazaguanine reductase [Porphyridium purpureum]|uniref:NADPH-dependent 7-cyano-7-deazaguanine reductase n=1 Tax=Porphyridium purpureum TaxID=35688 RepID=A0A5J4YYH9_PORPP|nr:NADPH-dependent 7-cyano-7-deazaguanine reductase [Porphyridium purpureum]|eukprot:POR4569..scf209_3
MRTPLMSNALLVFLKGPNPRKGLVPWNVGKLTSQWARRCSGRGGGESPSQSYGDYENAKQLGERVLAADSPYKAVLDTVPNPHPDVKYVARFACPEFTSLCPVTGQPDFAHLVIDYVPQTKLVESKSLKLYLQSFRNHGDFHEACTVGIARRLVEELDPLWLRIGGYWYPRGGIPIDVFYATGDPPSGVWIPDQGVPPFRGRG